MKTNRKNERGVSDFIRFSPFLLMLNRKWTILIPSIVGFALSVAAIWLYGFERADFGDAADYIAAAKSILDGTPYPRRGDFHPVFRAPVFPAFVALVWTIFYESVVAFKIAQAVLHAATCFVIYRTIYELVGRNAPAFFGALLCAVNPLLFGHTVDFFSEPLQTLLVALSIFVLIKLLKSDERLYLKAVALGVLFGLSTLCRPTIFPIILCLVPLIFLLFVKDKQKRIRYFFASGAIYVALFSVIAPWTYSNYRATGDFIPVVNGFGYNFWLGNHPETLRLYEGTYESREDNQKFADYWAGELPSAKMKELEASDNLSALSVNEQERVWRREALKNINENPRLTARLYWGKVKSYWTPLLNRFAYPFPLVVLTAIFVCGSYLFGVYGAAILWRDQTGRKLVVLLAAQFVLATLLHSLIIANVRYRTPYVDPFLCLLSGIALWNIACWLFPKNNFLQN